MKTILATLMLMVLTLSAHADHTRRWHARHLRHLQKQHRTHTIYHAPKHH